MDTNGTRYQLLLGRDDWARCRDEHGVLLAERWQADETDETPPDLAWDQQTNELTLRPLVFRAVAGTPDSVDPAGRRRGAAGDRYGNWYFIDDDARRIRVRSSGSRLTSDFWPVPAPAPEDDPGARHGDFADLTPPALVLPQRLAGLAVTREHYLLVGTIAPAGLLVFDLHAGGPPRQLQWPQSVPFEPWELAAAPDGGVRILDRTNVRYWALDRHLGVIAQDQTLTPADRAWFAPVDEAQPDSELVRRPLRFPTGIRLDASAPLQAIDPVALAALPDGTVVFLERLDGGRNARLLRYRYGQLVGTPTPLVIDAQLAALPPAGTALFGAALALQLDPTSTQHRLFVSAADGTQAFAFSLRFTDATLAAAPLAEYWPMRLFGGKALATAPAQDQIYYDFSDGFVPLVLQPRPRFVRAASLTTPVLDGRAPACVWHRLFVDGCIVPDAALAIDSRAADDEIALAALPWSPEPTPRRRPDGSELPFVPTASNNDHRGTFELLLQRAQGRYLQLRLRLGGNGRTSPRLHALRAYYPRFSYLEQYLPALYRDDPESASFLDRYLANLEGLFTAIEDKVALAQLLLDPRTAPTGALDWLASFFGIALDPAWDEPRRRLFLRHAMDFFRTRGTVAGLEQALRLALDDCPDAQIFTAPTNPGRPRPGTLRILERFRTRRTPAVVLGEPDTASGIDAIADEAAQAVRWTPAQRGATLHDRWRGALATATSDDSRGERAVKGEARPALPGEGEREGSPLIDVPGAHYPLVAPADAAQAAPWRDFSMRVLGFLPITAGTREQSAWGDFLARRYRTISQLGARYGAAFVADRTSFAEIPLPTALPPDGAALGDWYQFQALVLAMRKTAHRFTVLLPVGKRDAFDVTRHETRRALAERIVELEKPAHTRFDVKLYWALLRIGEARLGLDTALDIGSRAPELMPDLIVGRGFLAESRLAAAVPERSAERQVLGPPKPLKQRRTIEEKTP